MKKLHKFRRGLKTGYQFLLCTGKRCDMSESVTYRWRGVTCKACLKLRPGVYGGVT